MVYISNVFYPSIERRWLLSALLMFLCYTIVTTLSKYPIWKVLFLRPKLHWHSSRRLFGNSELVTISWKVHFIPHTKLTPLCHLLPPSTTSKILDEYCRKRQACRRTSRVEVSYVYVFRFYEYMDLDVVCFRRGFLFKTCFFHVSLINHRTVLVLSFCYWCLNVWYFFWERFSFSFRPRQTFLTRIWFRQM